MYARPGTPAWNRKFIEGKMFERMQCDRCGARFNFSQSRIPRCPSCGSTGAHPWQPAGREAA